MTGFCQAAAYAQSRLHIKPNRAHNWQKNSYQQKTLQLRQKREINPKNWRNSANNWQYKTGKFRNKIGIFDSDGSRFIYRDPRKSNIVVKPYANGRHRLNDGIGR